MFTTPRDEDYEVSALAKVEPEIRKVKIKKDELIENIQKKGKKNEEKYIPEGFVGI